MTLSALRFAPRPEGVNHVDHALVDAVLLDVQNIHVAAKVSVFRATGELLLNRFFGGDLDALARIGRNHASLAALLRDARLPVRGAHLWYALVILPHLREMGDELSEIVPMTHHRVLVHVDDLNVRRALAMRAVSMSREELQLAVTRWRESQLTRRQLDVRRARRRATHERRLMREKAASEAAAARQAAALAEASVSRITEAAAGVAATCEAEACPPGEAVTRGANGPLEAMVNGLFTAANAAGLAPVSASALAALTADDLEAIVSDLQRVADRVDDLLDVLIEETERRGTG